MLEYKFRGKRIGNGEWVYGDLIKHSIIDPFTYIAKGTGYKVDDPELGKPIRVYSDTVGIFTGQYDKNKKEIYEGDIDKDGGEVVWRNCDSSFAIKYEGVETMALEETEEWCEIVGTVHKEEI